MPLKSDRPISIRDQGGSKLFRKQMRGSNRCRKIQKLSFGGSILQSGNKAVKTMSAFRILEHLYLIDNDCTDVVKTGPFAEKIVHTLIRSDHNAATRPAVTDRPCLRKINAGDTRHYRGCCNTLIFSGKTIVLLVCQSNQRHKEEHTTTLFQIIFQTSHLADERLSRSSCRNHQKILSKQ